MKLKLDRIQDNLKKLDRLEDNLRAIGASAGVVAIQEAKELINFLVGVRFESASPYKKVEEIDIEQNTHRSA
jgi:hypothetical protein